MTIITVDHAANIDRIIKILKANSSIFDGASPTTKIRKIFFAETSYDMEDDSTPYIYVQVADNYQFTSEPYGTQVADFEQMQVAYNVVIVSQKKAPEEVFRDLSAWSNLVVQQLKNFPKLDDPSAPGTDKKVTRTNIKNLGRRYSQKGREKDGTVIQIQCQLGSAWQFVVGGTTIDLISKPVERTDKARDHDLLDDASFAITTMDNPGSLAVEYESTDTLDSTIRALIDGTEKSVQILHGGTTRTYVAVLLSITKPVPFDNLERAVLTMDTIQ